MNGLPIPDNVYEAAERVISRSGVLMTKKRLRQAVNAAVDEMSHERYCLVCGHRIGTVPQDEAQEDALTEETNDD